MAEKFPLIEEDEYITEVEDLVTAIQRFAYTSPGLGDSYMRIAGAQKGELKDAQAKEALVVARTALKYAFGKVEELESELRTLRAEKRVVQAYFGVKQEES